MSTVSGVYPNAITPTFAPSSDPAEQARLRRQDEAAVFSPVDEVEQNTETRRTGVEQPGRLEAEQAVNTASQLARNDDDAAVDEAPAVQAREDDLQSSEDGADDQRQQQLASQQDQRAAQDDAKLRQDIELIRELAARDQDVRNHEQAHQATGGQYAGAMAFTYQMGPDGKRYAVGGEVPIDVSKVPGDPEATLQKAEQVRRAALAPAEPSTQDRQVAALATQISLEAQSDARLMERQQAEKAVEDRAELQALNKESEQKTEDSSQDDEEKSAQAADESEKRLQDILNTTSQTVESALDAAYRQQSQQEIGFNLDTTV